MLVQRQHFAEVTRLNPDISVVIPVYNRPSLLVHSVESVLAQTVPVREVIVIDDGSTEDVEGEVRRNMAAKPEWRERVQYVYQDNQGQSVAFNNGIDRARGEWIGFNASDDCWLPWKLEWQCRALEKYEGQSELCFTDAWFLNNPYMKSMTLFDFAEIKLPGDINIVTDPVRLLLKHQPAWVQTIVASARSVRKLGGFDPLLRFSEDYDFVFRMAVQTTFCYVGIPMTLIDRKHSNERHSGASTNWHQEEYRLRMVDRRLQTRLRLTENAALDIREGVHENLRSQYSKWTNLYMKNGEYSKAREAVSAAARYRLTPGIALKWAMAYLVPQLGGRFIRWRENRDARIGYGINW